MHSSDHRYRSILAARQAWEAGENVVAAIRASEGAVTNSPHAIEIAYELQTGTYSSAAEADPGAWVAYGEEIASQLGEFVRDGDVVLDAGTGEMTSLTAALNKLSRTVSAAAFDISWSRVAAGRSFVDRHRSGDWSVSPFVGDMSSMALADRSMDVVMTVHALEPNGGREVELVSELLRVTRRTLMLFEPCYERAPTDARARMESHGYVRGLESAVEEAGGTILDVREFGRAANPLNPTWVIVVQAGENDIGHESQVSYVCPVTHTPLEEREGCFFSVEAGLAYPVLDGIPILRADHTILAVDFSS